MGDFLIDQRNPPYPPPKISRSTYGMTMKLCTVIVQHNRNLLMSAISYDIIAEDDNLSIFTHGWYKMGKNPLVWRSSLKFNNLVININSMKIVFTSM